LAKTEADERLNRALTAFLRQEVQAPASAVTDFLDMIIEDAPEGLLADLNRMRTASVQLNAFVKSLIRDSASDRRADETLEAFQRRLRHDLRTPLNAIKGYGELLIEARVKPAEVSYVKEGQNALVRLTALNQRLTPMIEGRVTYVSADAVPERSLRGTESDRRDSFIVRVRLDESLIREKVENFNPTPGMPADLFIETGHRTFFNYLMKPVVDSMLRAFREH
jgi:nitrogen-specific signal transduction histidine kinase